MSIYGEPFFCSWSGGKDSALAFHRAVREGGKPKLLLTMLHEECERSRGHGLPIQVLRAQASALGVQLLMRPTTWDLYESVFIGAMAEIKGKGITSGVFGDIDLEPHREWVRKVCSVSGIKPHHPLWGQARRGLLDELLGEGFDATIVAIRKGSLDKSFLGRRLSRSTIDDLEAAGVDASGELGEYHTVVTNGPLFSRSVVLNTGEVHERDGYMFLDVSSPGSGTCMDSSDAPGG